MTCHSKPFHSLSLSLPIALLALLSGCVAAPVPEQRDDPRLDHLVANMDQSLANQATVNTQLTEQGRQLDAQQQQLAALSQNIGKAAQTPVVTDCPKVAACPPAQKTSTKQVVGQLEQIWLADLELPLTARIDTGAETSSLDARNIELFERDGKRWVRFEIINPATGKPDSLERRLKRTVGIHQSGTTEVTRRPVIKMSIVIGRINQAAEFTLSDRSHLGYQVLIGRNILKDVMVVDVSKKNNAPYVLAEKSASAAGAAR